MQKEIQSIKPGDNDQFYRTWEGSYGTMCFVEVTFTDGDEGSYGTKPEKVEQHVAAMQKIIGVPSDFTLEPKEDFRGTPQWKIKDYPGNPVQQFQGGGGKPWAGGGGGGGNRDFESKEERSWRQASIMAQSSVKAGVDLSIAAGTPTMDSVADFASRVQDLVKELAKETASQPSNAAPVAEKAEVVPNLTTAGAMLKDAFDATPIAEVDSDWQELYDTAVGLFGSPVRLQIATKKNPDELTVDELKELISAASE